MPNTRFENILYTCYRMMRRGRLTINAICQKLGVTTYISTYVHIHTHTHISNQLSYGRE